MVRQWLVRAYREWLSVEEIIHRQGVRVLVMKRVILLLDATELGLLDSGIRICVAQLVETKIKRLLLLA